MSSEGLRDDHYFFLAFYEFTIFSSCIIINFLFTETIITIHVKELNKLTIHVLHLEFRRKKERVFLFSYRFTFNEEMIYSEKYIKNDIFQFIKFTEKFKMNGFKFLISES